MGECVCAQCVCVSSYLSVLELEPERQTWTSLQTGSIEAVVLFQSWKSAAFLGYFSHLCTRADKSSRLSQCMVTTAVCQGIHDKSLLYSNKFVKLMKCFPKLFENRKRTAISKVLSTPSDHPDCLPLCNSVTRLPPLLPTDDCQKYYNR